MTAIVAFGSSALSLSVEPQRIAVPLGPGFQSGGAFPEANIVMDGPRRAADEASSMHYTPAYSPYTYLGFNNQKVGMKIAQAFQMTPELVQKFAGNNIDGVFFYTGMNEAESSSQVAVNTIKKATLFLTYDLQNFEPFYTQTVDLPADGLILVEFDLTTPYTIEAGKPFYVGYYYPLTSANDLTIIVDAADHGNDMSGGWIGLQAPKTSADDNPEWEFDNFANQVGFPCLGAVISGDNLPKDEVDVSMLEVQPSAYQGEDFSLSFVVGNNASNGVSSFEAEVVVGENAPETVEFSVPKPLNYGSQGMATIDNISYAIPSLEKVPVTVTVTKVNGNTNNSQSATATSEIQIIPTGKGFLRNVVVEEFTGTWCPNCPRGLVMMEAIREAYTDGSVIPVGIHNGDQMVSPSYSAIDQVYGGSYPTAIMNRLTYIETMYPTDKCFAEIEKFQSYPAPAKVTATARFNSAKSGIIFDTKTSFSFDNDKAAEDYILAFGVTEDHVGPYEQKNGASGSTLPGWGNKPSVVETMYNDVARQYNTSRGITGSIPEAVEQGKEYDFSYEMKFLAASKISNKDNLNAIVYLINRKTQVVENACMINATQLGGIDDVMADSEFDANAPVEYFNLQGIRVAEPQDGLYIRRQGNTAKVVMVK